MSDFVPRAPGAERNVFRHRHRLHGRADFAAVHQARVRKHAGPLTVLARPSGRDASRLGLTVSRKVGPAVSRNRIKRRLREAFRLTHRSWPGTYDLVVIVRPHAILRMQDYQRLLAQAVDALDREWARRRRREAASGESGS